MGSIDTQQLLRHLVEEDTALRAYVHAATRNTHETEDILQTVWQTMWEKLDDYDDARPFRGWAFGFARIEVLRWRQRCARSKEYLSSNTLELLAATAEQRGAELDMRSHFLAECLERLKSVPRQVLKLKYFKREKIRAIAATVGKSIPAIEMTLVRSRRQLRRCIERKLTTYEEGPAV